MKREIKFRAWDKRQSLMLNHVDFNNCIVGFSNNGNFGIDAYIEHGTHEEQYSLELMQFTGLLDKNGREVFESDVLNWSSGAQGVVTWDNEECCFAAENFDGSPGSWLTGMFEVIGNIYEHPELVKP